MQMKYHLILYSMITDGVMLLTTLSLPLYLIFHIVLIGALSYLHGIRKSQSYILAADTAEQHGAIGASLRLLTPTWPLRQNLKSLIPFGDSLSTAQLMSAVR